MLVYINYVSLFSYKIILMYLICDLNLFLIENKSKEEIDKKLVTETQHIIKEKNVYYIIICSNFIYINYYLH